ncbi:hypothetical protein C8Q79DRAFT_456758 [Trametes meyenii]|nr:hypothetical protein C8Q79DRAFT_456758 [Trametes meyenii]
MLSVNATNSERLHKYYETETARRFVQLSPSDVRRPGYGQCAITEETFSVQSVHGKHFCVAAELWGPSLSSLVRMQPAAESAAKQTLLRFMFLNDALRVLHAGQHSLQPPVVP